VVPVMQIIKDVEAALKMVVSLPDGDLFIWADSDISPATPSPANLPDSTKIVGEEGECESSPNL
jgi:hypothetical protein